jgi:membrane peptidoglycan carboxypeptidase
MPAPKSTASSLLTAGLGMLGFSALAGLLAAVMVAPAVAVGGITANNTVGIFDSLPDYIELTQQSESNEIVAKNQDGSDFHIANVFDQNRQSVPLDQMSNALQWAAVAGEDRRYYQHGGVDIPSAARAAVGNASGDSAAGGASTITMQLVRNIRFQEASAEPQDTPEHRKQRAADIKAAVYPDLGRKVQEMKLAIGLEKKYSKQQILAGYLNIVGMGGNTYGVEAAAEQYYSTTAANLTVAQAASLVAIVQNPSVNNLSDPKNYADNKSRRDDILRTMRTEHYITEKQADEAIATPIASYVKISPPAQGCVNATPGYGFICDLAVQYITATNTLPSLGADQTAQQDRWRQGGLKVYVSIAPSIEDQANAAVSKYAPADESRFALGAASTTVEVGTGRILSMAQNKPYGVGTAADDQLPDLDRSKLPYSSINLNVGGSALDGGIGYQPGSSYKPYTLLSFLAAGHGVYETFNASNNTFNQASFKDTCPDYTKNGPWGGSWGPVRNDEGEKGPYNVVAGTAGSVNTVFIQMGLKVDQCSTAKIAESLGVSNAAVKGGELDTEPTCIIGGCSNNVTPIMQAGAYAAIANGGVFCTPTLIDSIVDADGNKLAGQAANCGQSPLVTPDVAHTAAFAMQAVFAGGGTATLANPRDGSTYLGKTGTTDSSKDTWTVGSSTKAATALWVGNIVGDQALRNIYVGGIQAASLRNNIFKATAQAVDAYPGLAGGAFPGPAQQLLEGAKTTVPTGLVGGTVQAAQSALQAANLTYQDGGPVDSDLPAGQVARLDPGEGSQVVQGAFVTVYTSNGQAKPIPNVVGETLTKAQADITAAGFTVGTTTCQQGTSVSDPKNKTVLSQDPGSGSANPASQKISLTYQDFPCTGSGGGTGGGGGGTGGGTGH